MFCRYLQPIILNFDRIKIDIEIKLDSINSIFLSKGKELKKSMGNKQSNTSYTDLFAWSSGRSNVITISDGVGKKKYLRFFGNAAQTNDCI